jgi:hypothetical protein
VPFETILAKEPHASGSLGQPDRRREYLIFRNMTHGITIKEKWGTLISDLKGTMSMVRPRLGTPPAKLEC